MGPFGGQAWRGCRPLETVLLQGPPDAPRLWLVEKGRRRRRDADALVLAGERARALGLRGVGWVAYEYGGLLETLPAPPGEPSTWPLLRLDFFAEQEALSPSGDEWAGVWGVPARRGGAPSPLRAESEPLSYRRGVERIRAWIRAGDCYQVNLVQAFEAGLPLTLAPALFATLRELDGGPGGYRALLEGRGRALLSDSPELFLARRGGRLWTQPIKGTAERFAFGSGVSHGARNSKPDAAEWLLASEKDRAELAMIVDLLRNDLSRVCRPGSVRVGPFPQLMRLPALVHTCATVGGRLRPGVDLAACFRAAFPGGSVTGCPRLRAMERIAQLEPGPRGPCFGAVGWLDPDGDFLFNVAIRTALFEDGRLRLLAGGGITVDSTPAAEEAESRLKTATFATALERLAARV